MTKLGMRLRHSSLPSGSGSDPTNVLVADDDDGFRAFVAGALERAGYAVYEAATGKEALQLASEVAVRVALLDVLMPDTNGYVVCRQLRERFADRIAIVFVSGTRGESYDRVAGLMIGADDYLVKPTDPDELVARVQRLSGPAAARAASGPGARPPGAGTSLTAREREVLALLVEGRTEPQIARALYISPKTVATHIQRILPKLGVHSRAQAVALAARERLVSD